MTTQEFIESIEETYAMGVEIIKIKNKDYANSSNPFKNFESSEIIGLSPDRAILVRILDKISRISNLMDKEADVKDESMDDTIIDCINYLAIIKAYRKSKELDEPLPF